MFTKDEIIFSYTRAQAIEDGILVDVSECAKGLGYKVSVAVNDTVWGGYINSGLSFPEIQQDWEERIKRINNILMALREVLNLKQKNKQEFSENIFFDCDMHKNGIIEKISLKAILGQGDEGESTITILEPHED